MPRFSASTSVLTTDLIRRVRKHLKDGGVIAYPTESCYGLGCDPRNRRAVLKILRLKGRPQSKGLILVGAEFSQLRSFTRPLSPSQSQKLRASWPGPVTWLLPAAAPPWLRGRHQRIAVRVTAHQIASRLCRLSGSALVSTSANRAGLKPLKTASACVRAFGADVLVVPGRVGKRKRRSTIKELESDRVLRE